MVAQTDIPVIKESQPVTHEQKQAEAQALLFNLLHMTTVVANNREPLSRGYKKTFARHFFGTMALVHPLLEELGENAVVQVGIKFTQRPAGQGKIPFELPKV